MIIHSDNTATELVLQQMGFNYLQTTFRRLGLQAIDGRADDERCGGDHHPRRHRDGGRPTQPTTALRGTEQGAAQAEVVVFLADGAPWSWERLGWVVKRVGLDGNKVAYALDWCHALHHVG